MPLTEFIAGMAVIIVSWLIMAPLIVVPVWRILGTTGRRPSNSLLLFVPLIGLLFVAYTLAFSKWPGLANPEAENLP